MSERKILVRRGEVEKLQKICTEGGSEAGKEEERDGQRNDVLCSQSQGRHTRQERC